MSLFILSKHHQTRSRNIFTNSLALPADEEILNLTSICHDEDDGENAALTYTVLGDSWLTSSFSVHQGALVARAGGLDRENTTQNSEVVFFVQATDGGRTGDRRKAYIAVTVEVGSTVSCGY